MWNIIVILSLGLAAVAAVPTNPQRIVGGSFTSISKYPEAAALLQRDSPDEIYKQRCGGSILNSRSILTAAHCVYNTTASQWLVRLGSSWSYFGGTVYNVSTIIIHFSYNRWNFNNDLAILRLSTPITFNNSTQPGTFAGPTYNLTDNATVYAVGWGAVYYEGPSSILLKQVEISVVNQNECRRRYFAIGEMVTNNMLCAGLIDVGGRDQCQGDSGGPLYNENVIVGVSSWGEGCGDPRYPGVNVRVSRYHDWLVAHA